MEEKKLLKVGYVIFQKRFRKRSRAQYQNKLVANQWLTWRTLAEPSDDRKIEMADKKTKEENICGTKEGLHVSTPDATVVVSRRGNS